MQARSGRRHDRFGVALGMLLVAVTAAAFSSRGRVAVSVALLAQALALAAIYRAGRVSSRTQLLAAILVLAALVGVLVAWLVGAEATEGLLRPVIGMALAVSAPAVIIRRLATHRVIAFDTVAGALCLYLLIGLFVTYALMVGDQVDGPVLAGRVTRPLELSDAAYFGFITLTTIGYGDVSPASGFARGVAIAGGLIGQLYLISAVAFLVGNLGRPPRKGEAEGTGGGS